MKPSTQRQLLNAIAAKPTPATWVVKSTWERGAELRPSAPMSYRMALAHARVIREGCGYAIVERA